MFELELDWNM